MTTPGREIPQFANDQFGSVDDPALLRELLEDGIDNEDQITTPGAAGLTCETCGLPLHYGGRGRKPRFCDEHKPNRKAVDGSTRPPRKPGRKTKRVQRGHPLVEMLATGGWGLAGGIVEGGASTAGQVAAGRVMQVQSPDAGIRIARLVDPWTRKLTWLNSVSEGGPLADLAAIVLPPLLVGLIAQNPAILTMFEGPIMALLTPMAEGVLKAQEEGAETLAKLTDPDPKVTEALGQMMGSIMAGLNEGTAQDGTGPEN